MRALVMLLEALVGLRERLRARWRKAKGWEAVTVNQPARFKRGMVLMLSGHEDSVRRDRGDPGHQVMALDFRRGLVWTRPLYGWFTTKDLVRFKRERDARLKRRAKKDRWPPAGFGGPS